MVARVLATDDTPRQTTKFSSKIVISIAPYPLSVKFPEGVRGARINVAVMSDGFRQSA